MLDLVGKIIAWETGELGTHEFVDLIGELVSTGTIWHLQGSYQSYANALLGSGHIDATGAVLGYPEEE
jgi:hypothetical protein